MTDQTQDETCKVTVQGAGLSAEKDVDVATALAVMQVLYGGVVGSAAPTVGGVSPAGGQQGGGTPVANFQPLSVREYLEQVGAGNIPAKIATIGRHMRDHEGEQDFSRDEIKARFRSAGEIMPGNFPRDFQKALQHGWIAEDPNKKGRYYVTRRGDEAINIGFTGTAAAAASRSRRRRPAKSEEATSEA